jgi:hypothetical protein
VSAPRASVDDYIRKYGRQISHIKIPSALLTDGKPDKVRHQLARLVLLRDTLKQKNGQDILASVVHDIALGGATLKRNELRGAEVAPSLVERGMIYVGAGGTTVFNVGNAVVSGSGGSGGLGTVLDPRLVQSPRQAGLLSEDELAVTDIPIIPV